MDHTEPITYDVVRKRIEEGYYNTKLEWVPFDPDTKDKEYQKKFDDYTEDRQRLNALFKQEAIEAVGLKNHPKADKIFAKAYDHGHSSGNHEILIWLADLAEIVLD